MNEIKITNKEKPEIILEANRLMMDSLDDKKAYDVTFSFNPIEESTNENKQTYTWEHGDFDTFYKDLKAGLLNPIDHYTGYIGYLPADKYMDFQGPMVIMSSGNKFKIKTVYDVVYLSGTKAILCMHNCISDTATWNKAKLYASSYRSGGYLPSLAQVGKWYCNNSGIAANSGYYTQLIKHPYISGSATQWWTSTQYGSYSYGYWISSDGRIRDENPGWSVGYIAWVCAFSV